MKCCQRFFDRPFSFRHFYSDGSYHVVNIEFCCWEAPQCTQVWRYEVCKWVLLLWRDVLWLGLWFVTPGPRSWRGQDEKLRAGRQRTVNRDNFSQSGRRSVNLRTNVWTFWVEHTKSQRLWCFCLMPMLWPWPPVLWWQCGLSHLVVTNKSNKNPQLIRSDSVQNSFFLSSGRSCWGWFIAMSQTERVEIDWKKSENYFKNYLQLIEDDTRS